ncbi:hypothetical protein B0J13DRAFT_471597 [Dactylonectria estremocensis]|uniref:Actin-related protein RO7 n=1 Tax=Dactylonectria estremocensis TaxID=1079267 RepID=A0A9P9J4P6_9HYPO|nr:hypothetical protein B0J13DRAFT_471597 [Dactylonectria estremocensis]
MASGAGPALAHRSVASIRSAPTQGGSGAPSTPHTPSRNVASAYGSPSTIRADDDVVVIELGSRHLRAGFAGDSCPKATLQCGPEDQRRVGDFRSWEAPRGQVGLDWAPEHEFWRFDLRDVDLGLCQDNLERVVRDAFTRFLLIDSRPRRLGLVLDSAVPVPLLTAVLDTMFTRFQSPTVSLMASSVMSAVSAGVRSALVIDMGWAETVVTSVYEYREVKSTRSIRGGRLLLDTLYKAVYTLMRGNDTEDESRVISFDECDDIARRLMWCRASAARSSQRESTQLETVEEQDESEAESLQDVLQVGVANVPINSTNPPTNLEIPFEKLAEVCDDTFFDPLVHQATFDDHELPIHLLVYQHLLQLPMDVRAICMSRIIFIGGCSNILGIKQRIIDDITAIVAKRGWAPVAGKGVDQLRNNPKLQRRSSGSPTGSGPTSPSGASTSDEQETKDCGAADARPEHDPIEAKVARYREAPPQVHGQFRVLHSLGPWIGGSLLCQLKMPSMALIDREVWLQQGANGASRPSDIDVKVQQRQSMTAGGYARGGGGHHGAWTLGTWGYL